MALQDKSFWPEMQQIANTQGWTAVGQLGDQGYWNKYPDYTLEDALAVGPMIANYQASQDSGGFGGLGDLFSNPLNIITGPAGFQVGGVSGASAATGNGITPQTLGLDAAGLAAGAGIAGSGLADSGGGGMWDWLDTIDNGDFFGLQNPSTEASGGSIWDNLVNKGLGFAQNYLTDKLNSNLGGGGGGILDTVMKNPLQAGINFTPFLLSAYLANQQRGDLNGVLDQINPQAYQRSILDPYDLQTSGARAALQNDLGLRGVAGSSFGNQQLNNFDYMHGIERGDLASRAALGSAGLQGQLINQRNLNSNLLLGSGLNATAKLFQPQTTTFPTTMPQPKPNGGSNLVGDLFNLGKQIFTNGGYFGSGGLFG